MILLRNILSILTSIFTLVSQFSVKDQESFIISYPKFGYRWLDDKRFYLPWTQCENYMAMEETGKMDREKEFIYFYERLNRIQHWTIYLNLHGCTHNLIWSQNFQLLNFEHAFLNHSHCRLFILLLCWHLWLFTLYLVVSTKRTDEQTNMKPMEFSREKKTFGKTKIFKRFQSIQLGTIQAWQHHYYLVTVNVSIAPQTSEFDFTRGWFQSILSRKWIRDSQPIDCQLNSSRSPRNFRATSINFVPEQSINKRNANQLFS